MNSCLHHELLRAQHQSRSWTVLWLTSGYLTVEVVGGFYTGSLALLADAGHLLADVLGIGMSLFALMLLERPSTNRKTYGHYRLEILAATFNAALLIVVALYIVIEAYQRFRQPQDIAGEWMLAVACGGLVMDLLTLSILRGTARQSLSLRSAYLAVSGDMLGSLGVIAAALIVLATGWKLADPIIGIVFGLFILPRAYSLLSQSIDILLGATPRRLNLAELRRSLEGMPGVRQVHDLHAWSITRGLDAMSGHLVANELADPVAIMRNAQQILREKFGFEHSTLQIESTGFEEPAGVHP